MWQEDRRQWLDELEPGSVVAVQSRYGDRKGVVIRTTKTQILIEGDPRRYRRKDGWVIGGDNWSRSFLSPWTKKMREEARLKVKRREVQVGAEQLLAHSKEMTIDQANKCLHHLMQAIKYDEPIVKVVCDVCGKDLMKENTGD